MTLKLAPRDQATICDHCGASIPAHKLHECPVVAEATATHRQAHADRLTLELADLATREKEAGSKTLKADLKEQRLAKAQELKAHLTPAGEISEDHGEIH